MNKILLSFGVAGVLAYCVPATSTNAISITNGGNSTVQPYAAGLIKSYEIAVSKSNGNLCLNGSTISSSQMKSIGFTNIEVQRSTDNKNWTKEKSLSDMLASSSNNKYINDYTTSVNGGYYYRIKCTHYAKESGLFGSSQSVSNTSNSVWIS